MAALRLDTYELAAWPRFLGRAFQNNGVWTALLTALSIAVFLLGAAAFIDPAALFGRHGGNFYALLSHNFMVSVFGAVALFVMAALVLGMARFWRMVGAPPFREGGPRELGRATHGGFQLQRSAGGGGGKGGIW